MIKNILKGVVIGIANIIPGVSGGTMAVSMGIYDKLIHAVTHLFSEFMESLKLLLPLVVGMVIALVAGARLIAYFLGVAPFQTNLLFIGLIIGGLPTIYQKVKGNRVSFGHIIVCVIFFVLVIGCAMLDGSKESTVDVGFSLTNIFILFGVGVIASATMVVPGVSGSMVLMVMGFYRPILDAVNKFIDDLVHFSIEGLISGCGTLVPFGIGVLFGIGVIAKIIEFVFSRFPQYAYWAIIGLIIASPIGIVLLNEFKKFNPLTIITGVVALAVGTVVALKLGEE
jgi:putative membrane protein